MMISLLHKVKIKYLNLVFIIRLLLKQPAAGGESRKRDSLFLYRKDRLRRSLKLKIARMETGINNGRH